MGRVALLPLILPIAACVASGPAAPPDPRAETLARLAKMTAHCGLPAGTLRLTGDGLVAVRPSPDTEYAKIDCVLAEIRKTGLKQRYAFIGNEAYDTGSRQ